MKAAETYCEKILKWTVAGGSLKKDGSACFEPETAPIRFAQEDESVESEVIMNLVHDVAVPGKYEQVASLIVTPASRESQTMEPSEVARAKRLRAEYGPWFLKRNRRWVLNDGFWGAWLCGTLGVVFDRGNDVFRSTSFPETPSNRLTAGALVEPVGVILVEAAKALAPAFPTRELGDTRFRKLIEIMKIIPRSEAFCKVQPSVQ